MSMFTCIHGVWKQILVDGGREKTGVCVYACSVCGCGWGGLHLGCCNVIWRVVVVPCQCQWPVQQRDVSV